MVIGEGLMAGAFRSFSEDENVIIFASGISDSTCITDSAYSREIDLLMETMNRFPLATLVYFSTTSITDSELQNTKYVIHKKNIENLIMLNQKSFLIFRVSNVVGIGGNKKNIVNYFYEKIINNEAFEVWSKSYRNLIGINEVYNLVRCVIKKNLYLNEIIEIALPYNIKVLDIVDYLGELTGIHPRYTIVDKGGTPLINKQGILDLMEKCGIMVGKDYIQNLLKKYISENK
jgi:UDP-2-acetamido-2,6-beta-L-arabino-hexul-4-ose reductase